MSTRPVHCWITNLQYVYMFIYIYICIYTGVIPAPRANNCKTSLVLHNSIRSKLQRTATQQLTQLSHAITRTLDVCDQIAVLQCVAVCCSILLQCVTVCCSVLQCVAVCCSVLQVSMAIIRLLCCSVLQCVAVCYSVLQCVAVRCSVLQCVAVCCSVLQCVAVCCSVLECVGVCCSVLQISMAIIRLHVLTVPFPDYSSSPGDSSRSPSPFLPLCLSTSLIFSLAHPRSLSLSLSLVPSLPLSLPPPPRSHACSIGANCQHRLLVWNFQQRVLLQGGEDP